MKKIVYLIPILILLSSCGPTVNVARVSTDSTIDLSGRWNDTDAQMVSKEMLDQMFKSGWISKFNNDHKGATPVLIVGNISNKTSEHINTQIFSKEIEKYCINSGLVDFVASSEERTEIREERLEQQENASMETAKQVGQESGADFMMKGVISSTEDAIDGIKVVYYQINLELINIKTNKKSWVGDKKIKKVISRSKWKG